MEAGGGQRGEPNDGREDQPSDSQRTAAETEAVASQATPPVRVCPHCAAQAQVAGEFCPHCGGPYGRKKRWTRRRKIVLAAVVAILVLGGAGAGVALKIEHDNDVEATREAREKTEEREQARERERQREEDAQAALDDVERDARRSLVRDLERSITKDGRKKVAAGLLDGPITKTSCTPVGGGSDDLSEPTGKYECLAVTMENADGTSSGYPVDATINFDDFSYTWQFGG